MLTDKQIKKMWAAMTPAQKNQLMRDVFAAKSRDEASDERKRYQSEDGIVAFVEDVLGAKPAAYQARILRDFVRYRRVAVRGPHGLGKTAIASWVVLWGMYSFPDDVKIPTTASVWRQLEKFLWPEIRKWSRSMEGKDFRVLNMALKGDNKEAFAVATDDPALIEGAHAKTVIYIFDEAKAIPDAIFDAAEGAFSGAGEDTDSLAFALIISTPGLPSGRFYDICSKKAGYQDWHSIHITLEEAITAGRISRTWAEQRAEQWGEESAVYKNRVLGEFDQSGEDNCIPLAWAEAAQERGYQLVRNLAEVEAVGVDPADSGPDKSAIARKRGRMVTVEYHAKKDTMQLTGRVAAIASKEVPIAVDTIGIGAGVGARLLELGYNTHKVNVGSSAKDDNGKPLKDITDTFEFFNLRSWIWWHLRDMLNPRNPDAIALPPDDDLLLGDLVTPKYTYTSDGKIKVESKDDIRKRLKRSTDGGDAVGLALYVDWILNYVADDGDDWESVYKQLKGTKSSFGEKSNEDWTEKRRANLFKKD